MKAALTGGSGFLGAALASALVRQGTAVRALVRGDEARSRLEAQGVETVWGELGHGTAPSGLVAEGEVLIHAAARVAMTGPWRLFRRDTVEATRELLDVALPRGPSRVVYVSSGAVYAVQHGPGTYAADRSPTRPPACNRYGRAKLLAEQIVRDECERVGCPWTIVRLGFLYGPGNEAFFGPLVPLLRRRVLRILGTGTNRIASLYLDDAVRAVLLAARHPAAPGRVFDVASDECVAQELFLRETAAALGLPPPPGRVPVTLAFLAAGLLELWGGITRRAPLFTRAMVGLMAVDQVLDASRIRKDLGWDAEVPFADGMRRMQRAMGRPIRPHESATRG